MWRRPGLIRASTRRVLPAIGTMMRRNPVSYDNWFAGESESGEAAVDFHTIQTSIQRLVPMAQPQSSGYTR